jgi:hypothetical protein
MSKVLILDEYKTIDKIKEGYSLARYGDGEFFCLLKSSKGISKLQKFDKKLREKLFVIFSDPLEKLLIGIPRMDKPKQWVINFNDSFSKFISDKRAYKESIFVSSFVSRPYLINKSTQEYFDRVKSIWENREIVLINFNPKLLNHYLFKDCTVDFIQILRTDCFNDYDDILNGCKKFLGRKKIFLISAGPTATCLAYDLTSNGEQCIDIGQIAFEYSLFKNENGLQMWTSQNEYRKRGS